MRYPFDLNECDRELRDREEVVRSDMLTARLRAIEIVRVKMQE